LLRPVTLGLTRQSSLAQETIRFPGPPPCHFWISGCSPQNGHGFASFE
jgi:hypothetical protein